MTTKFDGTVIDEPDPARDAAVAQRIFDSQHGYFARSIDAIADRLEALAAEVRSEKARLGIPDRTKPETYTGVAANVLHTVLWGLANANIDGLTRRAGETAVAAEEANRLRDIADRLGGAL